MLFKIKTKIKKWILRKLGIPVKSQLAQLDDLIYSPRFRWNNYIAVRQFGEAHKRWLIEQRYAHILHEFPDLDRPKKFNEKIHWLSLNYQDEKITTCCDKLAMKLYVDDLLGRGYTVPVIKTYERAADIDFSELPEKFAIKVNWGDGIDYSTLVTSKNSADITSIKVKMNNAMQPWNNLYYSHFFWGYKNVPGKIFVEQFIEHSGSDLTDYKFHCFNGVPKFVLVCEERSHTRMKKTFLDLNWKVLPCYRTDGDVNPDVQKPERFDKMVQIVTKLAEPFPFVRVDLYSVNGRIYVGEMTFHPGCGFESFQPPEWDTIVGDMLTLPERKIIEREGM